MNWNIKLIRINFIFFKKELKLMYLEWFYLVLIKYIFDVCIFCMNLI